jgi:hypothetical protein
MSDNTPGGHIDTPDALLKANAAMRLAIEARKRSDCCDGDRMCHIEADDEHPVLSDPEDDSDDTADPIHEFRGGWNAEQIIERFEPHRSSQRFAELLDEMAELHRSKSMDYGSEEDPLANIRHGAELVDIEPWRGCMVRIADKVQRLRTYCRTGRLVHEGVRDTLLDLASYSLLAIILHGETTDADAVADV